MYNYYTQKKNLFTEKGSVMFLRVRDNVQKLLAVSGAVMMQNAIDGCTGDSWDMLACVDRLVELGEIREITEEDSPGQYRVFIKA